MTQTTDTNKTLVNLFDLEDVPQEEREAFVEELGDVVMKSIFRKAWSVLDNAKREELTYLVEESENTPQDEKTFKAVLEFLDKQIPNIQEYAQNEIDKLLTTYREMRDDLTDSNN